MFRVHQTYHALHAESSVIRGNFFFKKKGYLQIKAPTVTCEILGPRTDECWDFGFLRYYAVQFGRRLSTIWRNCCVCPI